MIKSSIEKALYVAAIGTALALAACGDSSPFGPDPADVVFADTLGITLEDFTETESGLLYRDDVVGTGEPAAVGDTVTVSYTGWLVDGTQFDSFDGFTFTLGVANLIDGFTEGVTGMQVGGTRTVIIPASLAYGSQGSGPIPGNAVVVFQITLTDLGESSPFGPDPADVVFADTLGIVLDDFTQTASGLYYRDDVVGTGALAAAGDTVTVSSTGWLVDGTVFDSIEGFTFTLGVANLIEGFTEGVTGMQVGGTRTVITPASLAYGSQGVGPIPADAVLVFEIIMTALVKA